MPVSTKTRIDHYLWGLVREIGKRALFESETPYHAGSTLHSKSGASVVQVQRFLRHASASTALAGYICDEELSGPILWKAIGI